MGGMSRPGPFGVGGPFGMGGMFGMVGMVSHLHANLGIVAVQHDGQWYVSPLRTLGDDLEALLAALPPGVLSGLPAVLGATTGGATTGGATTGGATTGLPLSGLSPLSGVGRQHMVHVQTNIPAP
jgi:hypothetical protein